MVVAVQPAKRPAKEWDRDEVVVVGGAAIVEDTVAVVVVEVGEVVIVGVIVVEEEDDIGAPLPLDQEAVRKTTGKLLGDCGTTA